MVVLRRLNSLLDPTKAAATDELAFKKNELDLKESDDDGLKEVSGYVFYNTSKWTLKTLKETTTNSQQILLDDFEEYLHDCSDNVDVYSSWWQSHFGSG